MSIDATIANDNNTGAGTSAASTTKAEKKPQIKLSVSGILADLKNGLDREAIGLKYDLSNKEVTEIFKHPKLKGVRPSRNVTRIQLIDDTDDNGQATSALIESKPASEAENAEEVKSEAENQEADNKIGTDSIKIEEAPSNNNDAAPNGAEGSWDIADQPTAAAEATTDTAANDGPGPDLFEKIA